MENARNDNGTISPEEVKKLEDAIKQKQIGAVRIYDGALSEDFCNELIEVFDKNSDNHEEVDNDKIKFVQYRYSKFHKDEDVHDKLIWWAFTHTKDLDTRYFCPKCYDGITSKCSLFFNTA